MATKKVKWFQKDGTLLHPETEWSMVTNKPDIPDVSKYLTTDTAQTVSAKKTFTGYYAMNGIINSAGDTAPQFYGLRIKGTTGYGAQLNFGDGNFVCFYEYEDDRLRLHTKKFDLDNLSEGLSINNNVGTEGQVLTSHGAKAPTWATPKASSYTAGTGVTITTDNSISTVAASSSISGHVSTGEQTFAGRKTFNGGINIPIGATIQLAGSSGTAGYVLTSNGTSAPTWSAPQASSKLDAYPVGSIYLCWYYANSTSDTYHPAKLFGGSWTAIPSGYALWTWRASLSNTDTAHEVSAGLPNIKGNFSIARTTDQTALSDGDGKLFVKTAAASSADIASHPSAASFSGQQPDLITFDASKSSALYGAAQTVQPPAYKVFAWRRTA